MHILQDPLSTPQPLLFEVAVVADIYISRIFLPERFYLVECLILSKQFSPAQLFPSPAPAFIVRLTSRKKQKQKTNSPPSTHTHTTITHWVFVCLQLIRSSSFESSLTTNFCHHPLSLRYLHSSLFWLSTKEGPVSELNILSLLTQIVFRKSYKLLAKHQRCKREIMMYQSSKFKENFMNEEYYS